MKPHQILNNNVAKIFMMGSLKRVLIFEEMT